MSNLKEQQTCSVIDIEKLALESQVSMEQCMGLKRDFRYGFHSTENLKQFAEAYHAERAHNEAGRGEAVAELILDPMFVPAFRVPLVNWFIPIESFDVGTKLYTATPDQTAEIERLNGEIDNLHTVMMAAAVEITEHWDAHCDEEGYGPANLVSRLEKCYAEQYGYDAKTVVRMEAEIERLKAREVRMFEILKDCVHLMDDGDGETYHSAINLIKEIEAENE